MQTNGGCHGGSIDPVLDLGPFSPGSGDGQDAEVRNLHSGACSPGQKVPAQGQQPPPPWGFGFLTSDLVGQKESGSGLLTVSNPGLITCRAVRGLVRRQEFGLLTVSNPGLITCQIWGFLESSNSARHPGHFRTGHGMVFFWGVGNRDAISLLGGSETGTRLVCWGA